MLARLLDPLAPLARRRRWRAGLPDECAFWHDWLARRGGEWPADFAYRTDPAAQLEPHLAALLPPDRLPPPPGSPLRILDVGAGPMTIIGKRLGDAPLDVTAVDPLADDYNRILDALQIVPPVRTRPGEGERLVRLFGPGRFDLVVAVNAVDHARDPLRVIRQMLAVARPGAAVVLEHTEREGHRNNYRGLHQWNFSVEQGRFLLRPRAPPPPPPTSLPP